MRERLCSILVVLLIFFSGNISGQSRLTPPPAVFSLRVPFYVAADSVHVTGIPASFYSRHLGFFCRQELLTDKLTKVPVRFRIGSVDYTNYMEQKPHARFLYH